MSERAEKMKNALEQKLESVTLVAEATHLRHNLSAIIRTAESFGLSDVYMISDRSKKVSGAAKGAEKWVNLNIENNTKQCMDKLKSKGYSIYVADLHPDAYTPDTIPVDRPIAILMGTELSGVSEEAKAMADGFVIIPMFGLTQSLNVSVASACLLQRITTRRREIVGRGDLSQAEQHRRLTEWLERDEREKQRRKARQNLAREAKT